MKCFKITRQKSVWIAKKEDFMLPKANEEDVVLLNTGAKLYNNKGTYVVSSYAHDDRDAIPYLAEANCPLFKFLEGK